MIFEFVQRAGPFIFPLALIALVIAILAMVNGLRLLGAERAHAERLRGAVDAILFWGAFAAVLGFLGQWTGLYKVFRATAELGLSPACTDDPARCYAMGFAESLTTTITGLTIFLAAGLVWFILRSRVRHLTIA